MKRCLVSIGLCLAVCAGATQIAAQAAASPAGGPTASAAKKKKCGKKGKKSEASAAAKKGKCKKGGGGSSDIDQATALFAGSSFSASGCTSTTNCNRSFSNFLAFCRNATYSGRFELNDSITGSTFVDRLAGTWKFTAANVAQGTATLSFTVDQWQSDAGTAQPQGTQTAQVFATSATSFVIDGGQYTRSPGGAGC